MQVLITGAFGTLGFATAERLFQNGYKLTLFDLPTTSSKKRARLFKGRAKCVFGDICNYEAVRHVVAEQDAIVHAAAILAPASEKAPELSKEVNVVGTKNVIRAATESANSPRLIYPSSIVVYGNSDSCNLHRQTTDPIIGTDHYSSQKIECERLLQASDLDWLIARIGVSLDAGETTMDSDALSLMFDVSPDNHIEFVHPDDVACGFEAALRHNNAWGQVLHFGGGADCQLTQEEFMNSMFTAVGIGPLPEEAFGNEPYYTSWMDTSKSQELLDYQHHSFQDFLCELKTKMRFTSLFIKMARPIARRWLLRHSRPWLEFNK